MMLVVLGGLIVLAIISRGPMSTVIRGATPADNNPRDMGPHLSLLTSIVRSGERPDDWLVSLAIEEAWNDGDYQMADKLASAFYSVTSLPAPTPPSESPPSESPSEPIAFKKQSPIDSVKDDEWNDFVTSMARDSVEYNTDKHVGTFHHFKRRLSQLNIDPESLKDADSQYHAFERDILDCQAKFAKMIRERVTELVEIDGSEHVLTHSGILALLKTGGPKGAEKWLSSPDDRKSYPQTTEAFLRANGIF